MSKPFPSLYLASDNRFYPISTVSKTASLHFDTPLIVSTLLFSSAALSIGIANIVTSISPWLYLVPYFCYVAVATLQLARGRPFAGEQGLLYNTAHSSRKTVVIAHNIFSILLMVLVSVAYVLTILLVVDAERRLNTACASIYMAAAVVAIPTAFLWKRPSSFDGLPLKGPQLASLVLLLVLPLLVLGGGLLFISLRGKKRTEVEPTTANKEKFITDAPRTADDAQFTEKKLTIAEDEEKITRLEETTEDGAQNAEDEASNADDPQTPEDTATAADGAQNVRASGEGSLYIRMYGEGTSWDKFFQLFNASNELVHLSNYKWCIGRHNGSNHWRTFKDVGVAPGAVYFVYNCQYADIPQTGALPKEIVKIHEAFDPQNTPYGGQECSGNVNFNGDDALGLYKVLGHDENELVDCVGDFQDRALDRGWTVAGTQNATKDHLLIRKSTITTGNPSWNSNGKEENPQTSEWSVYLHDDI